MVYRRHFVGENGVANLSGRLFKPDEFRNMINQIASDPRLKVVNLTDCLIGNDGATAIADLMNHCASLENVSLTGNDITDEGLEPLARSLASNTSIQSLSLARNFFSTSGIETLANGLRTNVTLSVLNMNRTGINDAGAHSLTAVLLQNKTLSHIYIGSNNVSIDGRSAIKQLLHPSQYNIIHGIGLNAEEPMIEDLGGHQDHSAHSYAVRLESARTLRSQQNAPNEHKR